MADALLARESLDAEQVKRSGAGLPLDEPTPAAGQPGPEPDADARGWLEVAAGAAAASAAGDAGVSGARRPKFKVQSPNSETALRPKVLRTSAVFFWLRGPEMSAEFLTSEF